MNSAPHPPASRRPAGIDDLLRSEAASGVFLVLAAIVAMIWANSPADGLYEAMLRLPIVISAGGLSLAKPLLLWVNDGLMAVFFLVIGIEIKREIVAGELSSFRQMALPGAGALGGMVVPALIYLAFNAADPEARLGWAIPTATDIAFALGLATLLGRRVPPPLKALLMSLAVVDDLGAIVIIALFYTADLSLISLLLALLGVLGLFGLNRAGVERLTPYVLAGLFLWVCVLKSGVHTTLAGVVLGFAIPLQARDGTDPAHRVEAALRSWVTYAILPLFALCNAGVPLGDIALGTMLGALPLGVALGLVVGKPVGVLLAGAAAVRLGYASAPTAASRGQLIGVAMLSGIGFTMSLFIGTLAFESVARLNEIRVGVLGGSLIAAVLGYATLRLAKA